MEPAIYIMDNKAKIKAWTKLVNTAKNIIGRGARNFPAKRSRTRQAALRLIFFMTGSSAAIRPDAWAGPDRQAGLRVHQGSEALLAEAVRTKSSKNGSIMGVSAL